MSLVDDARSVVQRAGLDHLDALFEDRFRIAVAGMVKAGKSTLLNAVLGERLAATGAGECTRVVTWYGQGPRYEVVGIDTDGQTSTLRFDRADGLDIDLEGRDPAELDRLEVTCPTPRLTGQRWVDLPGHGSTTASLTGRAAQFLRGTDGVITPVDAVVYCSRHHHPADLAFMEAFQDRTVGASGAVTVLSRADELGGGRADAMDTARRVADAMAADPRIRAVCSDVIPVAGLLAETAATITNDEIAAIGVVARLDRGMADAALLSVPRFRADDGLGLDARVRAALVRRLGLYGLRHAVDLARTAGPTHDVVANGLAEQSGVGELRRIVEERFLVRSGPLRARTALAIAATEPAVMDDPDLADEVARIRETSPELRELVVLDEVHAGAAADLSADQRVALERLLGAHGTSHQHRLGLDRAVDGAEARQLLLAEHSRWAVELDSAFATAASSELSATAMRTCEHLVAGLG